jgi:hypothetical protein
MGLSIPESKRGWMEYVMTRPVRALGVSPIRAEGEDEKGRFPQP